MAIAKKQVSVTQGYKPRTRVGTPRKANALQRALTSLGQNAREVCEFITDEIVYATMDTVRVLNYLRYEFGFRARARVEPVVHELEHFVHEYDLVHDVGTYSAEQVGGLAKR